MKIKFKEVHIENFMSLGLVELSLDDCGYTLVSGVNNNPSDLARSNGSGKSSIFDAIMWCMTGETIRGNKDVVNINGNDGAIVDLKFDVDGHQYQLLRSKNHSKLKTNLKIYIDGEDKSSKGIRDSEKLLKEYIPDLTVSLIGSVIILGQGLPSRFTNNSPSGRKEVLEKLCKSDFMIQDLKDRITSRKSELSVGLRKVEDSSLATRTRLGIEEANLKEAQNSLQQLVQHSDFDAIINELNQNISELEIKISSLQETIDTNKSAIDDSKLRLAEIENEELSCLDAIRVKYEPSLLELRDTISSKSALLYSKEAELKRLSSIVDTCPTCGQKLIGVQKPDTTALEQELYSLRQVIESCNTEQKNINLQYTSEKSEQSALFLSSKKQLRDALLGYENAAASSTRAQDELSNNLSSLKIQLTATNVQRQGRDESIRKYKNDIIKYESSIKNLENELLYNNKVKDDLEIRLGIMNKFNTVVSREFRGYLLSSVIEFINTKAKQYCQDIFETDLINFTLDGNNISITYSGKEYESLSGGEKQKVDLIVQFSIRDMLCSYIGFSTNIIVLDEIFDNLDDLGCSKVINLISTKLSDISSIFIITHHGNELSIPCDNEIVIAKGSDGVSYLQ